MTGVAGDCVVIGAGLAGCALGYELARAGARVVIVDRASVGAGSSGRNAGGVRQQFTHPTNVEVAQRTIGRLLSFGEETGVDPALRQVGYMFLATSSQDVELFAAASAAQQDRGMRSSMIDPADVAELVPGMRTDDLGGALLSPDDGIVDPHSVVTGFAGAARRAGVSIRLGEAAVGATIVGDRIRSLHLGDGSRLSADVFVNAAGAWASEVASLFGEGVAITAWRSQLFLLRAELRGSREMPLTIDWSGKKLVMHREGPGLLVGCDNEGPEAPRVEPLCDWPKFAEVAGLVCHRMPYLEGADVVTGWAGYLELTDDENPLVGWGGRENSYLFAGFSGHGFSIVPGLVEDAAMDVLGGVPAIDLTPYRPDRFKHPLSAPEAFSLR